MSVIAFVPARCGSKSILDKNIKLFCNRPLIYWNLQELQNSIVDQIIVATDCEKVYNIVENFNLSKVKLYKRKKENATDQSTTESVMLEYINHSNLLNTDTFVLAQATSPFTQAKHFNEGLEMFKKYDSILSCVLSKKFIWNKDGRALNYDINDRLRRQDVEGIFIENGAFYINSVGNIKSNKNRISGEIGIYKMPEYSVLELDEPNDWSIAESVMYKHVIDPVKIDFSNIRLFLSDVDGVLTDAGMYYTESGDEFKKFCTYDGMGMKLLQKLGIKVGILTSEDRNLNRRRAKKLALDYDFHGIENKLEFIKDLCNKENITLEQIVYVGDDINCFELLSHVGIAACPLNAVEKIKSINGIIKLKKNGGEGAVRELIDKILTNVY